MKVLSNTAAGKAHGKIILIGEHAVVHNEPAIAIPFTSANIEVTLEQIVGESTMDSIYHSGKISEAPLVISNLVQTFYEVCKYFYASTDNMHLTIKSGIPAERGMGSSAAVATALVRALFDYFDEELSDEVLHRFVSISEKIAHGNPSGLDAKVVSSNKAIYFVRNERSEFFQLDLPGHLVIADTGEEGETIKAVTDVGKLVEEQTTDGKQMIMDLGFLTKQAREYIEAKNLHGLGSVLNEAQTKLRKLTVSNETLDRLIETAQENGALGAKLTGGGRGGCMIALVETAEEAQKLAESLLGAGATETWVHPLGANVNVK